MTKQEIENILGDKTEAAIELANNLLELKLKLIQTHPNKNEYIDEYNRKVYANKFGFSEIGTIPRRF